MPSSTRRRQACADATDSASALSTGEDDERDFASRDLLFDDGMTRIRLALADRRRSIESARI